MSPNMFMCGWGRGLGKTLIKDAHATAFSPGATTVAVAGRRRMLRNGAEGGTHRIARLSVQTVCESCK